MTRLEKLAEEYGEANGPRFTITREDPVWSCVTEEMEQEYLQERAEIAHHYSAGFKAALEVVAKQVENHNLYISDNIRALGDEEDAT